MISARRRHPLTMLWLLTLALVAAAVVSIDLGSTRLSVPQLTAALLGQGDQIEQLVIVQMRLPRLLLSLLIGAGMAVSGVILQGITRNDLASPDTVGVNAGSGLGMMFLLVILAEISSEKRKMITSENKGKYKIAVRPFG